MKKEEGAAGEGGRTSPPPFDTSVLAAYMEGRTRREGEGGEAVRPKPTHPPWEGETEAERSAA